MVVAGVGWPDVEELLMAYLAELAPTDTVTPAQITGKVIRVSRVGGSDDGVTDFPRVEVACYALTRNDAHQLGEQSRQRMLVLGGQAVDVNGRAVLVDFCRTDTPPEPVPYDNPDVDRSLAYYRLGLRR